MLPAGRAPPVARRPDQGCKACVKASATRLTVASRHAHISGDIYADPTAYWWSWGERIAPITDPPAAARKIRSV